MKPNEWKETSQPEMQDFLALNVFDYLDIDSTKSMVSNVSRMAFNLAQSHSKMVLLWQIIIPWALEILHIKHGLMFIYIYTIYDFV